MWKPHSLNPVIFDSKKARNAGIIYSEKNQIHRVFQKHDFDMYGASLGVSKIKTLTDDKYEEELLINISAHVGSLFAVVFFFKKEIINFGKNKKLFFNVILASLPLFFFGYLIVNYNLVPGLRTYKIIGWTTVIFGVLLYFADRFKTNQSIQSNFTTKNAVIIGFFQIMALVPGVSRSGIIMTAARMLNFKREDLSLIHI